MTEKELKRLSRVDLLEMLIAQSKKLERVEKELADAKAELDRREIAVTTSGTLAEAALKLAGIFETADKAAAQYIDTLRERAEQSNKIISDAHAKADDIEKAAEEKRKAMLSDADKEVKRRLEDFSTQFKEFLDAHT